ncbi:MAG TPA: PIG-L family deacetylase [Acetobacteraceae bacterium]|nr:PIG-L family deacetylase [Acetobacteraceae bacterium]
MTRRALALSPHLDDAAFSAGATLAGLAARGWEVTVLTAFTRSMPAPRGFALACQLDKGLPAEADYMAFRRAEDRAACAALGARPNSADDTAARPLAALLAPLLPRFDLLLAPQAVGGHVDHVQAVRALDAVRPATMPVLWWEDFPYVARPHTHPARPHAARFAALPAAALPGDAAAKLAACAAYATQLGFQFGGEDGLRRALDGAAERFRRDGDAALEMAA